MQNFYSYAPFPMRWLRAPAVSETDEDPQNLLLHQHPSQVSQLKYFMYILMEWSYLGKQTWPERLHSDSGSFDQSIQFVLLQTQKQTVILILTLTTYVSKQCRP